MEGSGSVQTSKSSLSVPTPLADNGWLNNGTKKILTWKVSISTVDNAGRSPKSTLSKKDRN